MISSQEQSSIVSNEGRRNQFDGPISGEMWSKVSALQSKYPDTFDWSVYDKLYERFVDNQPRGGVVFKTAFKLVNYHSSCSKCHYAFEIDSYGRGCIHNCSYCYAKDQLTSHGYWNRPIPFPVDLSAVRKIMYEVFETDKKSKWRPILEKRIPVRLGSMSDSFMWIDKKYGITKELLRILNYSEYPHIVCTRSDLVADDEYLNIFRKDLVSVQMSISGNNESLTKLLEPGAPSVKKRLAALTKLAENEIWTTVRLNPFFPHRPDGFFTDKDSIRKRFESDESIPTFNLFGWDFFDQLLEAKVPSMLVGFVRLSVQAINNIQASTGFDLKPFFKPEVMAIKGDKHFSDAEIAFYYLKLRTEAKRRGIRFSTCYIGNGIKDYHQYQNLWDNKKDCCDALQNVSAFKTTSQQLSWQERFTHAPSKELAEKAMVGELEHMPRPTPNPRSSPETYTVSSTSRVLPGINIQRPWSQLLLRGTKTVETRSYRLPEKYRGVELAIIETPGPKKSGAADRAMIVGYITFSDCFQYSSKSEWLADFERHQVPRDHDTFSWDSEAPKWGWVVSKVARLESKVAPPKRRGILFTKSCSIDL